MKHGREPRAVGSKKPRQHPEWPLGHVAADRETRRGQRPSGARRRRRSDEPKARATARARHLRRQALWDAVKKVRLGEAAEVVLTTKSFEPRSWQDKQHAEAIVRAEPRLPDLRFRSAQTAFRISPLGSDDPRSGGIYLVKVRKKCLAVAMLVDKDCDLMVYEVYGGTADTGHRIHEDSVLAVAEPLEA